MKDLFAAQRNKPFFLVLIRLVVMVLLAAVTYSVLRFAGMSNDFPPLDMLYFPFVNIVCGVVIWRQFRQYGVSVWEYLGFEGRRLGKDIAWGLLWLFVSYIPLAIALMASMYLMFGADMSSHFEQVFAKSVPQLPDGVREGIEALRAVLRNDL